MGPAPGRAHSGRARAHQHAQAARVRAAVETGQALGGPTSVGSGPPEAGYIRLAVAARPVEEGARKRPLTQPMSAPQRTLRHIDGPTFCCLPRSATPVVLGRSWPSTSLAASGAERTFNVSEAS